MAAKGLLAQAVAKITSKSEFFNTAERSLHTSQIPEHLASPGIKALEIFADCRPPLLLLRCPNAPPPYVLFFHVLLVVESSDDVLSTHPSITGMFFINDHTKQSLIFLDSSFYVDSGHTPM